MFIQTEATPNPATMKFLPGKPVLNDRTLDMPTREAATQSPLAERLFDLPHVGGVMLGPDFISDQDRRRLAADQAVRARRHHGTLHERRAGAGRKRHGGGERR